MTRTTLKLISCLVLTAGVAFADEESDELVEKVAVRNRLFSVAGRWEVGANVGFTLLGKLTEHFNFNASVAYNPTDWLGLELRGGYARSMHTSIADDLQDVRLKKAQVTDAADLWELTGHGVLGLRFQPIYGKINLMAELPIHFQLYLWAGGGAGYLKRESVALCEGKPTETGCGEGGFLREGRISPLVSLALGFRFFLPFQGHSIKLEVRDWSFLDQYRMNVDRATGTGGMTNSAGITNLVQIDLGYAFIF